jgi:hypothetical protein
MARGGSGSTLDPFSFPGCVSRLIDGCRAFAYQSNEFFSNLLEEGVRLQPVCWARPILRMRRSLEDDIHLPAVDREGKALLSAVVIGLRMGLPAVAPSIWT